MLQTLDFCYCISNNNLDVMINALRLWEFMVKYFEGAFKVFDFYSEKLLAWSKKYILMFWKHLLCLDKCRMFGPDTNLSLELTEI